MVPPQNMPKKIVELPKLGVPTKLKLHAKNVSLNVRLAPSSIFDEKENLQPLHLVKLPVSKNLNLQKLIASEPVISTSNTLQRSMFATLTPIGGSVSGIP